MWCVARFGTISTILKTWKTPYDQGDCQLVSPFTPVIELGEKHYSVSFLKGFYVHTCSTDFRAKRTKCLNIVLKYFHSGLKMVAKLALFNTARVFLSFLRAWVEA